MTSISRNIKALIVLLIACNVLLIGVSDVSRVSAQVPPYPPLAPSLLKVVRTSWGSANSSIYASPGDTNIPLYVTVQNIGNRTLTGIRETLILQGPFTNASGGQTIQAYYGQDVSPGITATTQFVLNIAGNASLGIHVLKMESTYLQVVSGTGATLYLDQKVEADVSVFVSGRTYSKIYNVGVYSSKATPGENVTISGTVVDTDTSLLYNTNISFSSAALSRQPFVYIGEADPNVPRPFSVTVQVKQNIAVGSYPIEVAASYLDSLGINHVDSANVTLQVIEPVATPSPRIVEPSPLQIIINALWGIFRFFFGSFSPFGFIFLRDIASGI